MKQIYKIFRVSARSEYITVEVEQAYEKGDLAHTCLSFQAPSKVFQINHLGRVLENETPEGLVVLRGGVSVKVYTMEDNQRVTFSGVYGLLNPGNPEEFSETGVLEI